MSSSNDDACTLGARLCLAAARGDADLAHALLKAGASPHVRNSDDVTPLFAAVTAGAAHIVPILLNAGARVDDACPLHTSRAVDDLIRGQRVCLRYNACTSVRLTPRVSRVTPLFVAAVEGWDLIVPTLLEHGADARAVMDDGVSPLYAAVRGGHTHCIAALLRSGADVHAAITSTACMPLHCAACTHDVESVCQLMDAGARVAHRMMSDKLTPLDVAMCGGCTSVSLALVQRACGEDLEAMTRSDGGGGGGVHPLVRAIEAESPCVATALLARGVDANAPIHGVRPLARVLGREGGTELLEALLAGGCDPLLPMNDLTHENALQIAERGGTSRAVHTTILRAVYARTIPN